jgi:sigma-E factor negative regulatory protein RseC
MYEHAMVTAIGNNRKISVTCQTESCANCHAGAFCSTKGKTFLAKNSNELPLKVGDEVELYLPPGRTILAGVITLMVPLMLFPVGYYLPQILMTTPSELIRILGGFVGIAGGFMISRIFSKVKANEYSPEITRKIENE